MLLYVVGSSENKEMTEMVVQQEEVQGGLVYTADTVTWRFDRRRSMVACTYSWDSHWRHKTGRVILHTVGVGALPFCIC